jgi:hypothetical protein
LATALARGRAAPIDAAIALAVALDRAEHVAEPVKLLGWCEPAPSHEHAEELTQSGLAGRVREGQAFCDRAITVDCLQTQEPGGCQLESSQRDGKVNRTKREKVVTTAAMADQIHNLNVEIHLLRCHIDRLIDALEAVNGTLDGGLSKVRLDAIRNWGNG